MTKASSKASHKLDSLAGSIAAFEGINDAHTLLVGPLSCKSYLTHTVDLQDPVIYSTDSSTCLPNFPFGDLRIPCTYVDEQDFIYGTEQKVLATLKKLKDYPCQLFGIINHSGTSLIGEDLNRIIRDAKLTQKTTIIDGTGFTGTYAQGFKQATIKILKSIVKDNVEKIPTSVNIIGPTIFHYNWENDVAELKRIFNILGIKINAVICANQPLRNLENICQAELNVITQEEYGDEIALFLEKEFGLPYCGLKGFAPFGLASSESWFSEIANWFKLPCDLIDLESKRVRKKCYPV
ncbi:MAG: hypothetical protein GX638_04990, partial [Crenarchaeota archaeon]|nr:hypothetical protein [Thermoproteota archaeon]